jgi:hypothetical protein
LKKGPIVRMGDEEYEMSPARREYIERVLPIKRAIGKAERFQSGIPEHCSVLLAKALKGHPNERAELEYILQNVMTPLSPEEAATFGVHEHPGFHIERGASLEDEYEHEDVILPNPAHPSDFTEGWPEQKEAILASGGAAIAQLLSDLFMVDSRAKSESRSAYSAHVLKWKLDDLLRTVVGPPPAPSAIGMGPALVEGFHRIVEGLRRGVELIPTPPDTPILEAEEGIAPPPLALEPGSPGGQGLGSPGGPAPAAPPSVRKLQKRRRPPTSNNEEGFGGGGRARRRTKKRKVKSRRRRRLTSSRG